MKQLFLFFSLGILCTNGFSQLEVVDNNTLKLGGTNANIYLGSRGKYGSANGFLFNTANTLTGLIIENGISESSGIYLDGDFISMWSPADLGSNTNGYIVKFYNEDGMSLAAYITYTGVFTQSDSTRKENIQQIIQVSEKLKKVHAYKYRFKKPAQTVSVNDSVSSISKNKAIDSLMTSNSQKEKAEESIGFLAQNLEETFPEAVQTDEKGDKYVNYSAIVPVLVQGFNEQQALIEKQQTQITNQEKTIKQLLSDIEAIKKKLKIN